MRKITTTAEPKLHKAHNIVITKKAYLWKTEKHPTQRYLGENHFKYANLLIDIN